MALSREEVQRKILHFIFGTIIPLGIFYIPQYASSVSGLPRHIPPRTYPVLILGFTLSMHIVAEVFRFRNPAARGLFDKAFGSMLRKEEAWKVTGSTWINAAAFICAIVFYRRPDIAFIVLWLFIWGDAVAALVGIGIGRIKIGAKSLEGSIACFITCLIITYGIFPFMPGLLESWGGVFPLSLAVVVALTITVFELVPIRFGKNLVINDNLSVPIIAGCMILVLERLVYA